MQRRNFGQAKKQREAARKVRQKEKLERKHGRASKPAPAEAVVEQPGAQPEDQA